MFCLLAGLQKLSRLENVFASCRRSNLELMPQLQLELTYTCNLYGLHCFSSPLVLWIDKYYAEISPLVLIGLHDNQ